MTQTTLNILTSRRNQITKTVDVVDFNGLEAVKQDSDDQGNVVFRGGVDYMGD